MSQKNIDKFNKLKLKYLKKISDLGINKVKLDKDFIESKLNNDDVNGLKNFIWRKLNSLVKINDKNFSKLQLIYFEMEQFIKSEQKSKDSTYVRTLYFESLIKSSEELSKGVLLEVLIIVQNSPHICDACKKDKGKTYNFNYALNNHILPHKDCTCKSGCICNMGVSGKRDSNGRLIYID
ncbi:hypothetical protein [Chryseobacterium sediminis]|uniref:Uncharacterized protein n=1 Tax=Chryseobacterium sediminis TaxID=1679494 RepID=A0A5B2U9C6_9FLAO|nr:hypothetical protein [Chryseobacterium sediminis]KAA2223036.1 hypothetical protein FW780_02190 [Chryseobacterium sediminis]